MKKTISLILILNLTLTAICYGHGAGTLRPQATDTSDIDLSLEGEQAIDIHELLDALLAVELEGVENIERNYDCANPQIIVNQGDIYKALALIIENAREATKNQGDKAKISIEASREDGNLKIEIHNTGSGMAKAKVTAFNSEEDINSTKEEGHDNGLKTAKELITRNGGTVTIDSLSRQGYEKIRLPDYLAASFTPGAVSIIREFYDYIVRNLSVIYEIADIAESEGTFDEEFMQRMYNGLYYADSRGQIKQQLKESGRWDKAVKQGEIEPAFRILGSIYEKAASSLKLLGTDKKDKGKEGLAECGDNILRFFKFFKRLSDGHRVSSGTTVTIHLPLDAPTIAPDWFSEYKPIDDPCAVEEYFHIKLPAALARHIYTHASIYETFKQKNRAKTAKAVEAILECAEDEFRSQLGKMPEADHEKALKYFYFYQKRAREDLLRKGAVSIDPEFDDLRLFATTLTRLDVNFIMIDDYFDSRWIYSKSCFSESGNTFPIHLSSEPYWHIIRSTLENSHIDKAGYMYLSRFEPLIKVVRERIESPDFVLSKTAELLDDKTEAESDAGQEAAVNDTKWDLLYIFEDLCFNQKRHTKAWLDAIKNRIIAERERGQTVTAKAAVELYKQIGGEIEEDRFTVMGNILAPVNKVREAIKKVAVKQTLDEIFFDTLSSLVRWIKIYNLDNKRGSGMTRRDFIGWSGVGTAAVLVPGGGLAALSKSMPIAREILLEKYKPTPNQATRGHISWVYWLLSKENITTSFGNWRHIGSPEQVFEKVVDITPETQADIAYRMAFLYHIRMKVFGWGGRVAPLDADADSTFSSEDYLLGKMRREIINKSIFNDKDRRVLLRSDDHGGWSPVDAHKDPESLEISNIIYDLSRMDVGNAIETTEKGEKFGSAVERQILMDERIGEDTPLSEIENLLDEYLGNYEDFIRKHFMKKIERICNGYIEMAKRKLKEGSWTLDKGYLRPERLEGHPDYAYLATLKIFYYNTLIRGPEATKEFFNKFYPGYREAAIAKKKNLKEKYGDEFLKEVSEYTPRKWMSRSNLPVLMQAFLAGNNDAHDFFGAFEKTTFFKSGFLLEGIERDEDIVSMGEFSALLLGLPKLYDAFVVRGRISKKGLYRRLRRADDPYAEYYDPEPLMKWLLEPLPKYITAQVFLMQEGFPERFKSVISRMASIPCYSIPMIEYAMAGEGDAETPGIVKASEARILNEKSINGAISAAA